MMKITRCTQCHASGKRLIRDVTCPGDGSSPTTTVVMWRGIPALMTDQTPLTHQPEEAWVPDMSDDEEERHVTPTDPRWARQFPTRTTVDGYQWGIQS